MSFIREVRSDIEREAVRLLREYRSSLFREAVRLCGDVHTAEDLVMRTIETFFAKREDELPPDDKTYSWLRTTLQNLYWNMVRTKAYARTVYVNTADAAKLDEIAPVDNSTDEAIVAHDEAELVHRAIASLPKETRNVIMLRYFESLSIGEIAKLTCRSIDSIKCNLYYARKVLAKRLAKALGRTSAVVIALLLAALGYAAVTFTGVFTPSEPPDAVTAEQTAAETAADGSRAAAETRAPGPFSAQYAGLSALASTNEQDDSAIEQQIIEKEQSMNTNTCTKVLAATSLAASLAAAPMALASSTDSYIRNGLVAHWDGVENAGRGVHDPSATVWRDLIEGREFTLYNVTVEDNGMVFAGAQTSYGELSAADTDATFEKASDGTLEIVYASRSNNGSQIFLQSSEASGHVASIWQSSRFLAACGLANNSPYFNFTSGKATNIVSVLYTSAKPGRARVNGDYLTSDGYDCWAGATDVTTIGTRTSKSNNPFNGAIYSIRVYNRRLTDEEIDANHAIDRKRFIEGDLSPETISCAGELIDVGTNSAKVAWTVSTDTPMQVTAHFVSGFEPDLSDGVAVPLGTYASGTVVTSTVAFARATTTYWRIEAKDEGGENYSSFIDIVPAFIGEDLATAPLQVKYDGPGASHRHEYDCWPIPGDRASSGATRFVEEGNHTSTCVGWTIFVETGDDVWTEDTTGTDCEASYSPDGRRRRLVWHTALSQNLPGGYIRLDSISATNGQQMIDTGYSPNYMTHSTLDLLFAGNYVNNRNQTIFGASVSADGLAYYVNFAAVSSSDIYFWTQKSYNDGGAQRKISITDSITKNRNTLSVDMEAGVGNYGGISIAVVKRTPAQTQPETVHLFGRKDMPFNAYPTMQLFGATFADGSTLRRDFVPAQSLETGRRGLYDLVDGNFHTNIVENGADFGGTVCGLHVDGEPSRLGEPTIPYGCNLLEDGTVFELAEPNTAKDAGGRMVVKSIARYSFNATTGQWEFADRTPGSKVAATYTGEPVKYVLEWHPGGAGFVIVVR